MFGAQRFMAFTETVRAIYSDILMPGVLLESEFDLIYLANGFLYSRERPSPLYGCSGHWRELQLSYGNHQTIKYRETFIIRGECMLYQLLAVLDSKLRFFYVFCRCLGSKHGAVAFYTSELAAKLHSGATRPGYCLAGDAAYDPMPGLLIPCSKYRLPGEEEFMLTVSISITAVTAAMCSRHLGC